MPNLRNSVGCLTLFYLLLKYIVRDVVSRDMSRSRDSLETQIFEVSVSSRSRTSEVSSRSRLGVLKSRILSMSRYFLIAILKLKKLLLKARFQFASL